MARKLASRAALPTLVLAFGFAVAWLYTPTIGSDFVMFDDDINVYQNPHLGDLTAERIQWAFTDRTYMHRFMPLGWLAWCGLLAGAGLDPAAYHAANVVLHAINAVLVFGLVRQLLRFVVRHSAKRCDDSHVGLLATLAALLWAVHPLRVEVVAWASGLLYLQATAWALLSGGLFLAALQSPRRRSFFLHGAAILTFGLSVATYPVALGWPVAFLALVLFRREPPNPSRGGEESPGYRNSARWFTPAATFALALAGVLAAVGARVAVTSYWSAPEGLTDYPLAERVARGCFALLYYVWGHLPLLPLTPVTEFFREGGVFRVWLWPSAFVVALAFAVLLWRSKAWRGVALWSLAYAGVAGPFLGVLDRGFEPADRYTYLPGVVLVAGLAALLQQQSNRWRRSGVVLTGGGLALALALAYRTREQLPVWRDSSTLYTHIAMHLEHRTARAVYLARHAVFHTRQGEGDAAAPLLLQARALADDPADIAPYEQLIDRLQNRARDASAEPVSPAAVEALSLAINAAKQRNHAGARAHFERALRLWPTYFEARYNFAVFLAASGHREGALRQRELLERHGTAFTPELQARLSELLGDEQRNR